MSQKEQRRSGGAISAAGFVRQAGIFISGTCPENFFLGEFGVFTLPSGTGQYHFAGLPADRMSSTCETALNCVVYASACR
jgi:hypothetical protein